MQNAQLAGRVLNNSTFTNGIDNELSYQQHDVKDSNINTKVMQCIQQQKGIYKNSMYENIVKMTIILL